MIEFLSQPLFVAGQRRSKARSAAIPQKSSVQKICFASLPTTVTFLDTCQIFGQLAVAKLVRSFYISNSKIAT
jgi:hypothetical protein